MYGISCISKYKWLFHTKNILGYYKWYYKYRCKIVALSYYEFKDDTMLVSPPILRQESYTTSEKQEDFVLVYLMNEDMLPQLISEANKHPDLQIHCFTKLTKEHNVPSNIKLFNLDGKLFQEKMKVCKSVVCSGGFETSAENNIS